MPQEEMKLVLEFEGRNAKRKLKAFNKQLGKETPKSSKKAVSALGSVSLAVTGINQALEIGQKLLGGLKKGIDFARAGAELDRTRGKFDRLAREIGTTGDILTENLQRSTEGMLSEMDAVTLATDFLRLGLVDTEEQVLRLANASSQLGFDLNELTLALANQSKRRLDQLGISVTLFNEKLAALKAQGMATNEAFTEAFLQSAEEQIKRVGEESDTTVGHWAQLDAHLKDARQELKLLAKEVSEGPLRTFVAFLDDLEQKRIGLDLIADGGIDAAQAMERLGLTEGEVRGLGAQVQQLAGDMSVTTGQVIGYAEAFGGPLLDAFGNLNPEIEEYIKRQQEANKITAGIQADFDGSNDEIERQSGALETAAVKWKEWGDAQLANRFAVAGLDEALSDGVITTGEFEEAVQFLDDEQKETYKEYVGNQQQVNELIDAGIGLTDAWGLALQDLTEEEYEVIIKLTVTGGGDGGSPVVPSAEDIVNQTNPGRLTVKAHGGPLGEGWTLVGDPSPKQELISPWGWVYDAETSRKLMESGILPENRRKVAGPIDGESNRNPPGTGGGGGFVDPFIDPGNDSGGGGSGGGSGSTTVTTQTSQQTTEVVVQETSQAVSQSVQAQITTQNRQMSARMARQERIQRLANDRLDRIIGILLNQPTTEDQREIALESQNTSGF